MTLIVVLENSLTGTAIKYYVGSGGSWTATTGTYAPIQDPNGPLIKTTNGGGLDLDIQLFTTLPVTL